MIFDSLKAYFFQGLTIVLVVLLGLQTWRLHGAQLDAAQAKVILSEERAAAATARAVTEQALRVTEQNLQGSAAQTRKDTNHAVTLTRAQRDSLLQRVRVAEASAKSASHRCVSEATPAASVGGDRSEGDGGELLGTLGEEDVREASRADTIRLQLRACHQQYNAAREALAKQP